MAALAMFSAVFFSHATTKALALSAWTKSSNSAADRPWMVPSDPVDVRVEKLLDTMTVDEMQAQTIHLTGGDVNEVRVCVCGLSPRHNAAALHTVLHTTIAVKCMSPAAAR
jgi:hypothetical protein